MLLLLVRGKCTEVVISTSWRVRTQHACSIVDSFVSDRTSRDMSLHGVLCPLVCHSLVAQITTQIAGILSRKAPTFESTAAVKAL